MFCVSLNFCKIKSYKLFHYVDEPLATETRSLLPSFFRVCEIVSLEKISSFSSGVKDGDRGPRRPRVREGSAWGAWRGQGQAQAGSTGGSGEASASGSSGGPRGTPLGAVVSPSKEKGIFDVEMGAETAQTSRPGRASIRC